MQLAGNGDKKTEKTFFPCDVWFFVVTVGVFIIDTEYNSSMIQNPNNKENIPEGLL